MIDYEYLVDSAMRVLIKDVLTFAEKYGLPGRHYFHISFITKYEGVRIPTHLSEKYSDEITIALQNQFRNLNVFDDSFGVDLSFNGQEARLIVPFCAITAFSDPSEDFSIRMNPDNTGVTGLSAFHRMNGSCQPNAEESKDDKIINFADIRDLLK